MDATALPDSTDLRVPLRVAEAVAVLWWQGKHLLALALVAALLAGCALPPRENLWRATRIVELVSADDASEAGSCGPVPSARVGYYLGGTRAHSTVPLSTLRDARPGRTAYFKADSKCNGLRAQPPSEAWVR